MAMVGGMVSAMRGSPAASRLGCSRTDPLHGLRHRAPAVRSAAAGRRGLNTLAMAGHGKFFVGGNWKCNGTVASVEQLVAELNAGSIPPGVEVVVAPPFVHIPMVSSSLKGAFAVSAQNCWVNAGGAFTGEVSPAMLADMNVPWVILGHSERRSLCGETNEVVGTKVKVALEHGIKVIACIGETLQERESGQMFPILDGQLQAIVESVDKWENLVIAYEPVWAIGTGVVASAEQAQEVHAHVRDVLVEKVGAAQAATIRILYGGSVNANNCEELAGLKDVDGFLVGGASLQGANFLTICNSAKTPATA